MTQVKRTVKGGNLDAITAGTGVVVPFTYDPGQAFPGTKLAAGTTYYFIVGDADATYEAVQAKWDNAIVITEMVIEDCVFPKNQDDMGGLNSAGVNTDVSDFVTGKGDWIKNNPPSAYVSVVSDDGTSGGATVTASTATVVVAGGTQGGCVFNAGNVPARRARLKVVVGGTGGLLRVGRHAKE